jgi:drug/metabolite transporter (DMT)-like permease
MWAANAVIGHYAVDLIPPMLFNFLRWAIVLVILLPIAGWCLSPKSGLWAHWKRYMVLGFLAVSLYNSFQYLALHTSSPINVTLIAASMPVWMIVIGAAFYRTPATWLKFLGAAASISGVLVVLSRGDPAALAGLQFVPGDIYILIAVIGWSIYSWMLAKTTAPEKIKSSWSALLLAQVFFGLMWSAVFTVTEAAINPQPTVLGWPLLLVLLFVAVGPAILAYRFWGEGITRVGPTVAGFFANLTPLFTAVMSSAFLGQHPEPFHMAAFLLIVGGIWLSTIRNQTR